MTDWSKLGKSSSRECDGPRDFLALARSVAESLQGVSSLRERPADLILEFRTERGSTHELYVGNMHAEWRDLPVDERRGRIKAFLEEMVADELREPLSWNDARAQLIPVVRGVSTFLVGDKCVPSIRRPFVPFLAEAVVADRERGMEYVTSADLTRWGVAADEAFVVAHENLSRADNNLSAYPTGQASGLLWVGSDDEYQSSRILLHSWLADARDVVSGDPVAIVPDRRVLVVGCAGDARQIEQLLAIAETTARESPRYISTVPYTVDSGGAVAPLVLPAGHPLAPRLANAKNLLAGTEYKNQKDHLNARFERDGKDVFVASYGSVRGKDGIERSYTTWGEGVDSLLPRTELVALGGGPIGSPGSWSALVRWEDVLRLAGRCLEIEPDLDPPRYRTVTWPTPDVVERLRSLGV